MSSNDLRQKLLNILEKDGRYIARRFTVDWFAKNNLYGIIDEINLSTQSLLTETTFADRIQSILNDQIDKNECRTCKQFTDWDRNSKRFKFYCSKICQETDPNLSQMLIKRSKKRDNNKANEKRKNTLLEKYGVEYNSQREDIKKILSQSTSDRFLSTEQKSCLDSFEWMNEKYNIEQYSMLHISRLLKVDLTTVASRCHKFNFEIRQNQQRSSGEKELSNLLESFGLKVINNHVGLFDNSQEVDIFLPNHNLAIEYCGERYHNELVKSPNYHENKWKWCKEKNIQLLTIFESEWLNKKDIILNFIKTKCGLGKRIYARNCIFKIIDETTARNFILLNHIQGNKHNINHAFGLYHDNILVGVVTYGSHHRQKNNQLIILNRLCFLDDIIVIGGTNKLIKNSLSNFDNVVITWSDNRFSTGNVYKNAGFKFESNLNKDYFYTDDQNLYNKQKFKNIKKLDNETEYEAAFKLGYKRIWDCGKIRWLFKRK